MTGKPAIVFDSCGFIGSHPLRALKESGEYDQLVAADIRKPRFTTDGLSCVTCDVREPVALGCLQGEVEIYNLAAVHITPGHEDWEYFFTTPLGAVNVFDFARRNGIDRIVFTSSISVYGPSEAPKDEDSVLEPESAYGRSKFGAEQIHRPWRADKSEARKLVVVRPALIYGSTESGDFTRLAGLLRKGRFVFPSRTDTIKACGYVEDPVVPFRFALARPEKELTNNFLPPASPYGGGYRRCLRPGCRLPIGHPRASHEGNARGRPRRRDRCPSWNWAFYRYDLAPLLAGQREMRPSNHLG